MRKIEGVAKYIFIAIILIILSTVDLDAIEDKLIFLKVFKLNINWLNHIVESYAQLFIGTIILIAIVGAAVKLSVSISGVSFAGFEITLKDTDANVKNKVRNYLNTKRSLFYIKPEYDNICEVFTSYYAIYDFLRGQLLEFENRKKTDSRLYCEIQNMLKELNKFLTMYQSDYRRWFAWYEKQKEECYIPLAEFQKAYPSYDILIRHFKELNLSMQEHAKVFDINMLDWENDNADNTNREDNVNT